MRILVLGGTRLVGRHLVEAALARGHRVTLFNRGQRDPGLFPEAERIVGDRRTDLHLLRGRTWDAAVDTSGYAARDVRAAAETLAGSVAHYTFVSTLSVFPDLSRYGMDEDAPVFAPDFETEEWTLETYGAMKVAGEIAVREALGGRAAIVRPGIVIGPHDYMDRFSYWCRRVAQGGEVLAPGDPAQPVQLIDARDLGEWMVRLAEEGRGGTFNATGPEEPLTFAGMLQAIRAGVGGDARFTWVPGDFLLERGAGEWSEFPLRLGPDQQGIFTVDNSRAVAAGLYFRPIEESARDVIAWEPGRPPEDRTAGVGAEREAELLAEWHETAGSRLPATEESKR